MTKIGIDLGKYKSDVCVMATAEAVTERMKIATTREALHREFANRPQSQIAIEASRDAGWVHAELTQLGHEVVMVDTTRVRAIGVGQGRRKNDRRDAEALARALWTGTVPRAHVLSAQAARLRDVLSARAQLVAQRTALIVMMRGWWQARGYTAPKCCAEDFAARLRATANEAVRENHVQAMLAVMEKLNEQIVVLESELEGLAEREEAFERLCSVPGVKLIVTLTFISALDRADRFGNAHQVQAYLGLVPSERTTGSPKQPRLGAITKAGNPMARWTLVQAAHSMLRGKARAQDPLVIWARQVQARRGKRIAVVALARRMAGILWAMWMDGSFYDAKGLGRASVQGLSRRARRAQQEMQAMHAATLAA